MRILLLGAACLFVMGCSSDTSSNTPNPTAKPDSGQPKADAAPDAADAKAPEDASERKALSASEKSGSCVGACDAKSAGNCWCDDKCATIDDCCTDHEASCTYEKTECEKAGGQCNPREVGCGDAGNVTDEISCQDITYICCGATSQQTECEKNGGMCMNAQTSGGCTNGGQFNDDDCGSGKTCCGAP